MASENFVPTSGIPEIEDDGVSSPELILLGEVIEADRRRRTTLNDNNNRVNQYER